MHRSSSATETGSRRSHRNNTTSTAAKDAQLVAGLNDLMASLYLPISILCPTDLTPSLLLAILECLLGEKLPLPFVPSPSRAGGSNQRTAADLKVQKVKMFLGVLETDVLQMDVGLSEVDPRRLAVGAREEAVFVAEVLVWIGERVGLLPKAGPSKSNLKETTKRAVSGTPAQRRNFEPVRVHARQVGQEDTVTSSSSKSSRGSGQSTRFPEPEVDTESVFYVPSSTCAHSTSEGLLRRRSRDHTSGASSHSIRTRASSTKPQDVGTPSSVALSLAPPFQSPRRSRSHPDLHHIHHSSNSLLLSPDTGYIHHRSGYTEDDYCDDIYASPQPSHRPYHGGRGENDSYDMSTAAFGTVQAPRVRYSGYIEPANEECEIQAYERSRSFSASQHNFTFEHIQHHDSSDSRLGYNSRSSAEDEGTNVSAVDRSILGDLSTASIGSTDEGTRLLTQSFIEGEYHKTLRLLEERTRLLRELADLSVHKT